MKKYIITISCIGTGLRKLSYRKTFIASEPLFSIESMATAFLTSLMARHPESDEWCVVSIKEETEEETADPQVLELIIRDSKITDCALKTRMVNVLRANDIRTIGDLLKRSPKHVRNFRYVGFSGVEFLQRELREKYNINWY